MSINFAPTQEELEFAESSLPDHNALKFPLMEFSPQSEELEFADSALMQQEDDFQPIEREKPGSDILRQATQYTTRGLEAGLGFAGDIESFFRGIIRSGQEGEGGLVGKLSEQNVLPTSGEFRELGKITHGEELEPQSETEEFAGNIIQDLVGGPGKKLYQKILASTVGNSVSKSAEALGAEEGMQGYLKMGSMLLASRFGAKNVKNYWNSEYNSATKSISNKDLIPGRRVESYLNSVEKKLQSGGHADWKPEVQKQIDALRQNIKNGAVKIKDVDQAFHDINSHMRTVKDKNAQKYLVDLKRGVTHELKQYGKKNPAYLKHFQNANAAYGGFQQSKKASEWAKSNYKKLGLTAGTALLAESILFHGEIPTKTLTAAAALYGMGKGSELITRVFKNPTLFKYYSGALAAASAENAPQLARNLSKLDEELSKERPIRSKSYEAIRHSILEKRQQANQ